MKTTLLALSGLIAFSTYLFASFQEDPNPIHITAWFPKFDQYHGFEVKGSGFDDNKVTIKYRSKEYQGEACHSFTIDGWSEPIFMIIFEDPNTGTRYQIRLNSDLWFTATLFVLDSNSNYESYGGQWEPAG